MQKSYFAQALSQDSSFILSIVFSSCIIPVLITLQKNFLEEVIMQHQNNL